MLSLPGEWIKNTDSVPPLEFCSKIKQYKKIKNKEKTVFENPN